MEWNGLSRKVGLGEQLEKSGESVWHRTQNGTHVEVAGLGTAIVTARRALPKARSLAGQR